MQENTSLFNSNTTSVESSRNGYLDRFDRNRLLNSAGDQAVSSKRLYDSEHVVDDPQLYVEPINSMGARLLHLMLNDSSGSRLDRIIHLDDEAEFVEVCQDLAIETDNRLQDVESRVAQIVAEHRSRWVTPAQSDGQQDDHFLAKAIDSAAFAKAQYFRDWLIKGLLVRNQPVIIGGPHKSLKTSLILDLAISVGSGRSFLGKFEVPQPERLLVLSGESGEATLQETALRICQTKKVNLNDCDIHWNFDLPQLKNDEDIARLQAYVAKHDIKVVIIDPLYLAMQGLDLSAANLFAVGPLLRGIAKACADQGATMILVHHTGKLAGKERARTGEPIELPDLAYAGFAEFARQWMLLSRREVYEPGTGVHKLWLNVGGSSGQGGLWGLDIEEGVLNTSFGGRRWQVKVMSTDETRRERLLSKDQEKQERETKDISDAKDAVMRLLRLQCGGETTNKIKELADCKKKYVGQALLRLELEKLIERTTITKPNGRGTRPYEGWTLTKKAYFPHEEINRRKDQQRATLALQAAQAAKASSMGKDDLERDDAQPGAMEGKAVRAEDAPAKLVDSGSEGRDTAVEDRP